MVANIVKAEAQKLGTKQGEKRAKQEQTFHDLCSTEWSTSVSTDALKTLEDRKYNAPKPLPLSSQVTELHKYIEQNKESKNTLMKAPNRQDYALLSQSIMASIVMFNRRRSGDVYKIKYKDMDKAKKQSNQEIMLGLSKWTKKLCSSLKRVEVGGKSRANPVVPILMTKSMNTNVEFLISQWGANGVKDDNPYLFAIPLCDTAYRGSDALRRLARSTSYKHSH